MAQKIETGVDLLAEGHVRCGLAVRGKPLAEKVIGVVAPPAGRDEELSP